MRIPLTEGRAVLVDRLKQPGQVQAGTVEAEMPPYMESFLAHLRLLVGVPFEYLIPDPRLLPDESIRFFYLDRSWSDRLVDGAIAVGKIGSREQAHHHGLNVKVSGNLDVSERMVRALQRGKTPFEEARRTVFAKPERADLITGFVMRSGAVSGWPHMDVRGYRTRIPEPFDASAAAVVKEQVTLLRLERLSPGVLFALFDCVPELVTLEEPHHGVQFGVEISADGMTRVVPLRTKTGQLLSKSGRSVPVSLPRRAGRMDIVHVSRLRELLAQKAAAVVDDAGERPIAQSGSAAFAIAVLDPPWRQRFEGTEDQGNPKPAAPQPPIIKVRDGVRTARLRLSVEQAFIEAGD